MINNTEVTTTLATLDKTAVLRVNSAGKTMGKRWNMAGDDKNPKAIAATLKATAGAEGLKLSNKALKAQVNAVMRGDLPLAWANYDVHVAAMRATGNIVPTLIDSNKAENKYKAEFVKLSAAPKASAAKITAAAKELTKAEKQALIEQMQAELKAEADAAVDSALNGSAINV